ncbi:hypothetical protein HanRHA438_Chr08g0328701 [Helianthus annuus]|nr:hypothetical protein HanRHA438_Chr08g0328701 [Helianthus annuus]
MEPALPTLGGGGGVLACVTTLDTSTHEYPLPLTSTVPMQSHHYPLMMRAF